MRITNSLFLLVGVSLFWVACGSESAPTSEATSDSATTIDTTTTTETPQAYARSADGLVALTAPDCELTGDVLDGNQYWVEGADLLAVIKGQAQEGGLVTHDQLELLDGRTCEVKHRVQLPKNTSPDFPYYLGDIQYNNVSNLLAIRGHQHALVCDLSNEFAVAKLEPTYFSPRAYDDAQSGMLQHIELWEDYLIGAALDCGTFAFDLADPSTPAPILPFAEWVDKATPRYHSLYLLPATDGVQAIMPHLDLATGNFELHPLFETPLAVATDVAKSARTNPFLVLRQTDEARTPVAIDLRKHEVVELPATVAEANTQTILDFLSKQ
ncbi:MAG: hypothetical protein AAGJ82_01720 [Bacteroidota bacterium]